MIFLMLLSFISIWIIMGNMEREPNWRLALVQSLILWGAYLVLGTEFLSIFKFINRQALSLMWILPMFTGMIWTFFWLKQRKVLRLPVVYHRHSWGGMILDILVVVILFVTALVAFMAPPNTKEAMVTHMSRVAHWEQNQTLAHFPTGNEAQNSNAPGSDLIALNFYILGKGDRAVALVSWIGFAGSVAAAASLAEVLGAKVNGQRMAAIFTATLPAAITQATGMANHGMAAFWIVSAVLLLICYIKIAQKPVILILSAVAAALAVVTTPAAFIYLWPFGLYAVVILRRRLGMVKMFMWAGVALMLFGLINGGYLLRNQRTYGKIYRPTELSHKMNDVRNWKVMVSNLTRNAALHADLPFPRADTWLMGNLQQFHTRLGLDIADPRTTLADKFIIPEVNTSEMTSGNPLHAALIIFSVTAIVGMVLLGKQDPNILAYTGAVFCSLLFFCYVLKWEATGGNLQLPFFILFAPLLAVFLDWLKKPDFISIMAVLLLVYAIPWLFQTYERPIFPDERRTSQYSVFIADKEKLYFSTIP